MEWRSGGFQFLRFSGRSSPLISGWRRTAAAAVPVADARQVNARQSTSNICRVGSLATDTAALRAEVPGKGGRRRSRALRSRGDRRRPKWVIGFSRNPHPCSQPAQPSWRDVMTPVVSCSTVNVTGRLTMLFLVVGGHGLLPPVSG